MVSLETLENISSSVNFFSPYDANPPLSVQMQRPSTRLDEPPPIISPITTPASVASLIGDCPLEPLTPSLVQRALFENQKYETESESCWDPELIVEPWILDDDIAEDSARVLKSSMFPYSGAKRARIENFQPDLAPPTKRATSPESLPNVLQMEKHLTTGNMILMPMTANDWSSFLAVHGGSDEGDEARLHTVFAAYLDQWEANRLGPFVLFAKERSVPKPVPMTSSAILNSGDGQIQHLAGFLKFSLQDENHVDGHPCLHIRLALLPQYRHQRRVMYESIQAAFEWILGIRELFRQFNRVYIPFEISASRQNSIAMTSEGDPASVMISSDTQEGAQQQMILVARDEFCDTIGRLAAQLASPEMIQQVINADIYSTRSEQRLFEMVVKWEIPLLKINDNGAIHLFMSTYHDTPVETTILSPLPDDGLYKMRLDLCAIGAGAIEACCRIKTKDVIPSQATISFSGVRKAKVGDKSKLYVIRSQLLRVDDKKHVTIVDSCLSSVCQLTSSRRVYRAADEAPAPSLAHKDCTQLAAWRSTSPLLSQFLDCCHVYWKAGYPHWLFTQEKVVLEVCDMGLDEHCAMKMQLVDVQSNLPVHLVSVAQGAKTTSPILVALPNDDGSWCTDLRVNSKKEVMNRMSYLLVSFHKLDGGNLHAEAIAEFASTFVVNVGTTYANLRRRPSC